MACWKWLLVAGAVGGGGVLATGCGGEAPPQCVRDEDCGAGNLCQQSACVPIGTGGDDCTHDWNLLKNGSFEAGEDGWRLGIANAALSVRESGAKCGSKALRITSTGSVTYHAASDLVTVPAGTLCARAWMRGTTTNGHLRVIPTGGTGLSFSSPVSEGEWVQLPPSKPLAVPISQETQVHVRIAVSGDENGRWLEADDVRLWRSADGSCTEH